MSRSQEKPDTENPDTEKPILNQLTLDGLQDIDFRSSRSPKKSQSQKTARKRANTRNTGKSAGKTVERMTGKTPGRTSRKSAAKQLAAELPVASVVLDVQAAHLGQTFDYLVSEKDSEKAQPGVRVRVPFGGQRLTGYIWKRREKSEIAFSAMKYIERVVSEHIAFSESMRRDIESIADFFAGTKANVVRLAIPPRVAGVDNEIKYFNFRALNEKVAQAAENETKRIVSSYRNADVLAAAVNTRSFVQAAWDCLPGTQTLARDAAWLAVHSLLSWRAIVLVMPDIRLVRDVVRQLKAAGLAEFDQHSQRGYSGDFVIMSSVLTPADRYRAYAAVASGAVKCVVGTRAAMYAPVEGAAVFAVVDDTAYANYDGMIPYANVRDVLKIRAENRGSLFVCMGYVRSAFSYWDCEQAAKQSGKQPGGVYVKRSGGLSGGLSGRRSHFIDVRAYDSVKRKACAKIDWLNREELEYRADSTAGARIPHSSVFAINKALENGPVLLSVPAESSRNSPVCAKCRRIARCRRCMTALASAVNPAAASRTGTSQTVASQTVASQAVASQAGASSESISPAAANPASVNPTTVNPAGNSSETTVNAGVSAGANANGVSGAGASSDLSYAANAFASSQGLFAASQCAWCGESISSWKCRSCGCERIRNIRVGTVGTAKELTMLFRSVPIVISSPSVPRGIIETIADKPMIVIATPGAEPKPVREDGRISGYSAVAIVDAWTSLYTERFDARQDILNAWMRSAAMAVPRGAGGRVMILGEAEEYVARSLLCWDGGILARTEVEEREINMFPPACAAAVVWGQRDSVMEALKQIDALYGGEYGAIATVEGEMPATLGPISIPEQGKKSNMLDGTSDRVRAIVRFPVEKRAELSARIKKAAAMHGVSNPKTELKFHISPKSLV